MKRVLGLLEEDRPRVSSRFQEDAALKLESQGAGSSFMLELEMANVGKTPATLVKLENLVPDGLVVDRERLSYPTEDNYIDLKGRRLGCLKNT